MTKIVINSAAGEFGLSDLAISKLVEINSKILTPSKKFIEKINGVVELKTTYFVLPFVDKIRSDPDLVKVVSELRTAANGKYAKLKIVEIPDDVSWYIGVDDCGVECVCEKSRSWK